MNYELEHQVAASASLELVLFVRELLPVVSPWFDDEDTRRWLGGAEWPESLLNLVKDPPREHRGSEVRERIGLAIRQRQEIVGLVDAEVYADGSAAVALVIAPHRRRSGLGATSLVGVAAYLRRRGVTRLTAGIAKANVASLRCARRAGFTAVTGDTDEEGFIEFERRGV